MRYSCEILLCYNQTEYEIRVIRSEGSPYHSRSKKPARCTSACSRSRSNVRVTFADGRLQDCIKITVPADVRSDSGERDWVYQVVSGCNSIFSGTEYDSGKDEGSFKARTWKFTSRDKPRVRINTTRSSLRQYFTVCMFPFTKDKLRAVLE